MILKSKRNVEQEGVSVNQLYPVVECEENIKTGIMKFIIYDDYRSFSWKTIDNFFMKSDLLENYSKNIDIDTINYKYNELDKEFFYKFYLENEDSRMAVVQLEKVMDVNEYLLEIIVDNIKFYREPEIENLLMEIYMNVPCSKEIVNIIDNYWN